MTSLKLLVSWVMYEFGGLEIKFDTDDSEGDQNADKDNSENEKGRE